MKVEKYVCQNMGCRSRYLEDEGKCLDCGGELKKEVVNYLKKKEAAASVALDGQTHDASCPHDWRFELPEGNGTPYEVCAICQATRLMPEIIYQCPDCDERSPSCAQCHKICKDRISCWDDGCDTVHLCSEKCSIEYAKEVWNQNNVCILEHKG